MFIAYVDRATIHSDMLEYLTDPDKKEKEMLARYKPDRIFPEIMGGSSGTKMPKQAEDCESSFGGGIERAIRR